MTMNKLAVGLGVACVLAVGPVGVAVAQGGVVPTHPSQAATHATGEPSSAEPSSETEATDDPQPAAPTSTPDASEQPQAADHTFTHGLPGAVAASATPGDGFGKYVSGINKTGAPGAVASIMGKGKGHS
jgi:septal ring-binding cell division protein DamX